MQTSKQLFEAAKRLSGLIDAESNDIARAALKDARVALTLKATDQLLWEIDQAKKAAA